MARCPADRRRADRRRGATRSDDRRARSHALTARVPAPDPRTTRGDHRRQATRTGRPGRQVVPLVRPLDLEQRTILSALRDAAAASRLAHPRLRPRDPSALEVVEQARLDVGGANPSRRRHEGPHLASAHEPAAAELDALQLPGSRPAADRGRSKTDVGVGQDARRLLEADPVTRGWRHPQSSPPAAAGFERDAEPFPAASVVPVAPPF